jgi:7,8-dihydropterin-6-yl-methyl-4-(beta-D-ribofuranosyl)aminobenzene 5'-phosphate synthase
MTKDTAKIKEADSLEIVSLVDNALDFHSSVEKKEVQSFRQWTKQGFEFPRAEHGFSMLLRINYRSEVRTVLFDTGCSTDGVVWNAKKLGVDLGEIELVVLSHGHYDHFGGLLAVLEEVGKTDLPLVVHEDMFKVRGQGTDIVHCYPSFPSKEQLSKAKLVYTKQPQLFLNDLLLVTGEIPRETSFEIGFLQHKSFESGAWKTDPSILDDRAIAVLVKEKGLVVVSGCAHAGIVNTVRYAKQIAEAENVYAVIGGLHLAGKQNEIRIDQTVDALKRLNPQLIISSHCTGWKAMFAMAKALPNAFVWGSVGNRYSL